MININELMDAKIFAKPDRPAVGKAVKLPNVKKLLLPDEGFIMADADLAQADARVVAWDADDETLKEIFLNPDLDLHTENAKAIYGSCPTKDHPNRKLAKAGVHAVNYHVFPQTLAIALGVTVLEAEFFINRWFSAHPKLKAWHERINTEMKVHKCVANAFNYQKKFFASTDHGTALSEALAWIPQSTVGIIINKVWAYLDKHVDYSLVEVKMQVHDSLVFQIDRERIDMAARVISDAFKSVIVPYADPLNIPSTLGIGLDAGELTDVTWDGFVIDSKTGLATQARSKLWP